MLTCNLEVFINEVEFKRTLRSLGIVNPDEWKRWCDGNLERRISLHLPLEPIKAYENPQFWAETEARYPENWSRYEHLRKVADGKKITDDFKFVRFASRYKVAKGYRGIRFSRLEDETADGYSAWFGVFLAYSALESCCDAVIQPILKQGIIDPILADQLRLEVKKSADAIVKEIGSKRMMNQFDEFMSSKSNDVLCFASVIKHLVANGSFISFRKDVAALNVSKVFDKLAQTLLQHADKLLGRYCLKISRMNPKE
jgi:hypothetical protein